MERKELKDQANLPDSFENHVLDNAQNILLTGISTVPTTANKVLDVSQATIISNTFYWNFNGTVFKWTVSEST